MIAKVEGASVTLGCKVTGHPTPHTTWLLNNEQIEENENLKVSKKGSLKIAKASEENQGNYTCQQTNRAGSLYKVYKLSILSKFYMFLLDHNYSCLTNF